MRIFRHLPSFAIACAASWIAVAPCAALADGCAMPRVEKAKVEMADQRAILHYDGQAQVETLVIDTQIKPVGKEAPGKAEYAWVVPLPAVPTEVKATTAGAVDTMQALAAPDLVLDAMVLNLGIGLFVFALIIALSVAYPKSSIASVGVGVFLLLLLVGIFVPVLGVAGGGGGSVSVKVYRSETIGSYDTTVLTSADGLALNEWLAKNGYPMPKSAAPVVAQLAKEGWCFVAMRLHESADGFAHPHPMKFVFPAKRPVYPMRLTGAGQATPLSVDLFVLGAEQATAPGFQARCAVAVDADETVAGARRDFDGAWETHRIRGARAVPVVHPEVQALGLKSKAFTWLRGEVPPSAMGRDVELGWEPLTPYRERFYSRSYAAEWGAFAGILALAVVVVLASVEIRMGHAWSRIGRVSSWGAGAAVVLGCLVYAAIPVQPAPDSPLSGKNIFWVSVMHRNMCMALQQAAIDAAEHGKPFDVSTVDGLRAVVRDECENGRTGIVTWKNLGDWRKLVVEGDSPDNMSIRMQDGKAQMFYYDDIGRELRLWPAPTPAQPHK